MTNSRFEDLERRCQKLKRARIAKIVLFFASIAFFVGGYFYIDVTAKNPPVITTAQPTALVPALPETNATSTIELGSEENNTKSYSIEENTTQESEKQNYDTLLLAPKIKNGIKQVPTEEKVVLTPPVQQNLEVKDFSLNEELKAPGETKTVLNMSVKSLGAEESLLKNFHSVSTFKTALELAEYYFEAKEYAKAIAWAKESSKLGPTSEKPWIIYAKSKFYLGEKKEAIRSLEIYLGYSSSKEVKDLLNFYKGQQ